MISDSLRGLTKYNQFILWKPVPRDDKIVKLPVDYRTLTIGDAHDPSLWMDYQTANDMVELLGEPYGLGFVFTHNDPFFFIDIDDCLIDGQWSPDSINLMNQLPGAAIEISQSGQGLHIIGTGNVVDHSCKSKIFNVDLYTESRFVALTDNSTVGSVDTVLTPQLEKVVQIYFKPRDAVTPMEWTDGPVSDWAGPADDDDLIKRALKSSSAASAFGGRASFADLWKCNIEVLKDCYPPDHGKTETKIYDDSKADAALAQHLAFWTGKDCERIKRLMFRSGLSRDKYNRDDYLPRTISNAVSMQREVHGQGTQSKPVLTAKAEPELVNGYQYLAAPQQVEHFKGCVYIVDLHRVFTPNGMLLKQDQFNAVYGGYCFQMDADASKTTRKAWEAFTESQVVRFPKASGTCFKPDQPPGYLAESLGRTTVNIYVPVDVSHKPGDPARFLQHIAKLLPDERDQQIIISYMAACVQYKGFKFQWTPLIQGVEGNGKTLLTRCVAAAIGRQYVHFPKAMDIDNKFNGWLLGKIFIGIEDIYVPDHRREVLETLKPMITGGDGIEIQLKGADQITADVCANFMLNSNHKDAVRKTFNDRRFCVFYTAQQRASDIQRDGMDGDYFPLLYNWLRDEGYSIITDYLMNYTIPDELNPATHCHRAPETTSTLEAIAVSMGGVEQEVLEAIDEGRPGFAGGWISSKALDRLLNDIRRNIPLNKRRELLQSLGYDWHPKLKDGRVNNYIVIDDGKPRLFIRDGHLAHNLNTPAEITKAYIDAQTNSALSTAEKAFNHN